MHHDEPGLAPTSGTAGEPRVAAPLEAFIREAGWLTHHKEWHAARRCNGLSREARSEFETSFVPCNPLQEGFPGSGLEFFAMHRVMIQELSDRFPDDIGLSEALTAFPLTNEFADTLPSRTVDNVPIEPQRHKAKQEAIRFLLSTMEEPYRAGSLFPSDDELGRFVETIRVPRPDHSPGEPSLRGLHAFFHHLYANANSTITVSDHGVNLLNLRFWRIHGWIDRLWQLYRDVLGLPDSEPEYVAALERQRREMMHGAHHSPSGGHKHRKLPKEVLEQITERDGHW